MKDENSESDPSVRVRFGKQWWNQRLESSGRKFSEREPIKECDRFWPTEPTDHGNNFELSLEDSDELPIVQQQDKEAPESLKPALDMIIELLEILISDSENSVTKETELKEIMQEITGLGRIKQIKLAQAGYITIGDIIEADKNSLSNVDNIGIKFAEKLKSSIKESFEIEGVEQKSENSYLDDSYPVNQLHKEIDGLGQASSGKLFNTGFETVGDLRAATREKLKQIPQIGPDTVSTVKQGITTDSKPQTGKLSVDGDTPVDRLADIIPGFARISCVRLREAGFETVADLRSASVTELTEADNIGQNRANRIKKYVGVN